MGIRFKVSTCVDGVDVKMRIYMIFRERYNTANKQHLQSVLFVPGHYWSAAARCVMLFLE